MSGRALAIVLVLLALAMLATIKEPKAKDNTDEIRSQIKLNKDLYQANKRIIELSEKLIVTLNKLTESQLECYQTPKYTASLR